MGSIEIQNITKILHWVKKGMLVTPFWVAFGVQFDIFWVQGKSKNLLIHSFVARILSTRFPITLLFKFSVSIYVSTEF